MELRWYPPSVDGDAQLLRAWADGDATAGNLLFDHHYRSIYRFFVNKLRSLAEVEDLVQQSFMACVESAASYRAEGRFRSYLFGIARKILLKHLRDRARREVDPASSSIADCGLGANSIIDAHREQRLLLSALRHIPIDSQIVLEMSYWEQMPAKAIAEALGETLPAIRGRLRKAKLELRGTLDALARSPEELASTLDGLDGWAAKLRADWS